jgi:hypothetical protein
MTTTRPRQILLAFTIAMAAIGLSASPGHAFSSEAREMCIGDAMRLCSDEIPNVSRITACMHRKRAQLSAGCRAVMDREASGRRNKRAAAIED